MGQSLKKNINPISSTVGAIIGSLICPGIGTVVGSLVIGIPSLLITSANGIDGGPVEIGYSTVNGFTGGYYNEKKVKEFIQPKKELKFEPPSIPEMPILSLKSNNSIDEENIKK